ncbi:MAG: HAD-IIB family hydrolase, partial [Gammaproteobacteria bacterium]
MRYLALACDYDATLATNGQVDATTITALERLLASGRRLLLVTGRELEDLVAAFPRLDLFDWVIAENGALLYRPSTREEKLLADTPPPEFVATLRERNVPLSVGRVIVATFEPNETTVLEVIRDLGLELQVIFNKGAVMVLPSGVNKATGLAAALEELKLSAHNVVGVGDAENDHAFLQLCECSAAVANALPAVMDHADFVTRADHGAGARELIDKILKDDLRSLGGKLTRHHLRVGSRPSGEEVRIPPYGVNLLVAGSSGGGKSTLTTGLLERFGEGGYQFCVIDPEGDYEDPDNALMLGHRDDAPSVDQVLQVLDDPARNVAVNLVGLPLEERPRFFGALISRLQELRARTGRPHW